MKTEKGPAWYDHAYQKGGHNQEYFKDPKECIYLPVWEAVLSMIDPAWIIADVGCGPGQFAALAAETHNYGYGVDHSAEAIAMALVRNPDLTFHQLCINENDLPPKYDVVVACEVLEHIVMDLNFISRIPKGKSVVITVPSFDSESHVRHFLSGTDAINRYSTVMEMEDFKVIDMDMTHEIFIFKGIRL